MKINIAATRLDLTAPLRLYVERKLAPTERLIAGFDPAGGAKISVEVSRATRHHRRGEVYFAALNLRMPKAALRAEAKAGDARAAIDMAKDTLFREIRKYKTKSLSARRR